MITRRLERRQAREPLAEALLALGASLTDATTADEVLDRLGQGLAGRDIAYALLGQRGPDFTVVRATLPFATEVWGRPLRLPVPASVLTRGRPIAYANVSEAFSETAEGRSRPLLTGNVRGTLLIAPAGRGTGDGGGVLCLVSPKLGDGDRAAAWGLALQLGAALRASAPRATEAPPAATPPSIEPPVLSRAQELPVFDLLTRRLSNALSDGEAVRAGIETLAPSLHLGGAAVVLCQGQQDVTTVYTTPPLPAKAAETLAGGALNAFLHLTGQRHRRCAHPPFETAALSVKDAANGAAAEPAGTLDAPLVTDGEVIGLVRVALTEAASGNERLFFTVANQVSLALERIAAQRKAERAQLASLAESLSDGIVLVDADLRVTSCNSAAQQHLSAIAGERIAEGATLDGSPLGELAQQTLSSGQATPLRELAARGDAAARRYLVAMAAPLAGSPEGSAAVVIVRDVTEERLMQERLLQSEKMVSVGQLVSGVAHELNNPLTGIMGFAQLLQARDLDERTLQDVGTIFMEAERASKIVQNLLSFARRKRADKELVNLNALLERVLELRNYDLRVKNIELVQDLDPALPETMVDADQIQQVFVNVIINAEQAMIDANGRGTLTVRSRRQGDAVRLSLQDDGPGMPPEQLRRIFDPFFTTKQAGDGTGLGLTISYGIIDEHGGRIWAESEPGRGTTFHIELPIVQGERARAPEAEAPPAAVATGRAILVVDDEESIQRLLGSILQMDGHRVDVARNGVEALERIGRQRYDMIITDIKMPDMDGRSLYQRLREIDPALARHTVFITGDTVSPETRSFLEQVRNPCLAKPFRVRDVRETILQTLEDRA